MRAGRSKRSSEVLAPVKMDWVPDWASSRLQSQVDQLFDTWLAPGEPAAWMPSLDVFENRRTVVVKTELPGLKREEIEVSLNGEMLTIEGERKQETRFNRGGAYRIERSFGRFHRSVPLPCAVDAANVRAEYKDGVLTVNCPKRAAGKRRRTEVEVK